MTEGTRAIVIAVLTCSAFWGTLQGIFKYFADKKTAERDAIRAANTAKIESIESEVAAMKAKYEEMMATNETQNAALREILRTLLEQRCGRFLTEKEEGRRTHLTINEAKSTTDMYEAYAAIGGNGTGKMIYERVMKIPIKQEGI